LKVHYCGDVNEYRKFALRRLLSQVGQFKIGICWMLRRLTAPRMGQSVAT